MSVRQTLPKVALKGILGRLIQSDQRDKTEAAILARRGGMPA
jgi:hypothetical protein